jgi:site-specific DNA-methyltransferase (adenine-specific)
MATLTLYQGDCLEVMKEIESNSIDLIICDLPYGCLAGGCDWDLKIDLNQFWEQVKRIRRSDHTPTIHFCTTKFGYELIQSNPDEFRYDLVWDKQRGVSFLSANKMPMRSHEMIYIFSKAGAFYQRKDIEGDFKKWTRYRSDTESKFHSRQYGVSKNTSEEGQEGKRCALSVIKTITTYTRKGHPTEKPKELYRWLIERYCPPTGTVLDPTFGSGNSVFTAFELGRSAIGIEKDEAFFDKASEKII